MLSAIVIVEPERPGQESRASGPCATLLAPVEGERGIPLAFVEVLGKSVFARLFEELRRAGVSAISVYGSISEARVCGDIDPASNVEFRWTKEPWTRATQRLLQDRKGGVDQTLIVRVGAYVDVDWKDAFQFHREQRQGLTRVLDEREPLDIWIVNPAWFSQGVDIREAFGAAVPARYLVRGYVNRLESAADLRRLAVDGLTSRCHLRPSGTEARPGVWMGNEAQVDRDSRLVAPAFIGRGTKIAAQCLITRCSNVEGNCHIDYGTVVEDSSILSNSYVGIGLDVSHSIVDGSRLLNLERNIALEIADPSFMRQTKMPRLDRTRHSPARFDIRGTQSEQVEEGLR